MVAFASIKMVTIVLVILAHAVVLTQFAGLTYGEIKVKVMPMVYKVASWTYTSFGPGRRSKPVTKSTMRALTKPNMVRTGTASYSFAICAMTHENMPTSTLRQAVAMPDSTIQRLRTILQK